MRCLLLSLLAVVSLVPSSGAQEWPRFRGPTGQGISAAKDLPLKWSQTENIAWKKELPGAGTSSPIIVGKNLFVTCQTGYGTAGGNINNLKRHLLCLDFEGNIVWNKDVPASLPEKEGIRENHGYVSSTPVSDGERIYVFFGKSGVFAFSLKGEQLWQGPVGDGVHGWGSAASPILYKDLVIANASVESESLVAFDKTSGKERWRARGIAESWNTPIVVKNAAGKDELVVAAGPSGRSPGRVLGFDPDSGDALWSCATDIPWYMVPSLVSHEDVVYCIGGRGTGGALAVKTGGKGDVTKTQRLWAIKKGSNVPSPLYHEGHLYWAHDVQNLFYCVEAKSGRVIYEERADGADRGNGVYASPILADGKIYYVTRGGLTVVVPAAPEFKVLAVNNLSDRSMFNSTPIVAGNRLLIRSEKQLYCVGK